MIRRVLALVLAAACGPGTPETEEPPPGSRCGATCEEVDLRGPLTTAPLGDTAAVVAARRVDGRVLLGVARVADGAWDGATLRLRPLDDREAAAVALAPGGDGVLMAVARDDGVELYRLGEDGEPERSGHLDGLVATRLAVASGEGGEVLLGAVTSEAKPRLVAIGDGEARELAVPEGVVADVAVLAGRGGPVAAFASERGVAVMVRDDTAEVSEEPAREVALAAIGGDVVVAFAAADEVRVARLGGTPAVVDDGGRPGEPAHRVGASLVLLDDGGRATLAYQDQTAGVLVVAVEGPAGWARRELASAEWTRGMHVALVHAGGVPFVLDLGVRARPALRMAPFATPLR